MKDARCIELPKAREKLWYECVWGETEIEAALPELDYPYTYRKRNANILVRDNKSEVVMKAFNIATVTPDIVPTLIEKAIEAIRSKVAAKSETPPVACPSPSPKKVFPIFESRKRARME